MFSYRTIAVLGSSCGGAKAAQDLASGAPPGWRVLLIDRNLHFHHLYIFPRVAVLPGHEHKAFIPTTNVFRLDKPHPHLYLNAEVLELSPNTITLSKSFPDLGIDSNTVHYDYLVYALGAQMPGVLDLWDHIPGGVPRPVGELGYDGTKQKGREWMQETQRIVKERREILVAGGGALGVQFATDIKSIYPEASVTLLHSRDRLLPRFDEEVHFEITKVLEELNIRFITGQRLDMSSVQVPPPKDGERQIVRTESGLEIATDLLLLCTGAKPNTHFLKAMDPLLLDPNNHRAKVLRTMQVTRERPEDASVQPPHDGETTDYPHIFAIGDASDAFGAIQAGHTAYYQAIVAAANILKLIQHMPSSEEGPTLDVYTPTPPAIKVTLGLTKAVFQSGGVVGTKNDGVEDLQAAVMWPVFGAVVEKDDDMYL